MLPLACVLIYSRALPRLLQTQEQATVPVTHCRASKVMQMMMPLLKGMDDVQVHADDRLGVLAIRGSGPEVLRLTGYVHSFDVHPMPLRLQLVINSPADHWVKKTVTDIANNEKWTQSDPELNIELEFTARLNDDNTMTIFAATGFGTTRQTAVLRTRVGTPLYLRPGFFLSAEEALKKPSAETSRIVRDLDEKCVPTVRLKIERDRVTPNG